MTDVFEGYERGAGASFDQMFSDGQVRNLPAEMRRLQSTCSDAADAVAHRYFDIAEPITWAGGLA
jgi:hypothetical protein